MALVLAHAGTFAQSKLVYTTTSGEWIFSAANIKTNGIDGSSVIRFSPVFNFQNNIHFDRSEKFGVFTGIGVRNVGFIYDSANSNVRKKYRSYNLGIPIGFKVGNMSQTYIYGGYEIEFAFSFKEKTFKNEEKTDKSTVWFSKQTNTVNNSLFVGVQFPQGFNLKFKYYLTNFFNKNYTAQDSQGNPYKPYANMDVNVFYFSLNFFVLKNAHFYYGPKTKSTSSVTMR